MPVTTDEKLLVYRYAQTIFSSFFGTVRLNLSTGLSTKIYSIFLSQPACSLVDFSQSLSISQQCFSLTTNQHQPNLSAQKPTSEQAQQISFSRLSLP